MLLRPLLTLIVLASVALPAATGTLDIYFIDVEGGQSTLIVTPSHQSLLVDAGFPGDGTFTSKPGDPHRARDAMRVAAAAQAAGLKQIDYMLVTHFHPDHDGGVPELSQLIPIGTFIDHGSFQDTGPIVPGTVEAYAAYAVLRRSHRHIEVMPGDRIPLKGIRVTVVSSLRATIGAPLAGAGARNTHCAAELPAQDDFENPRSIGFRLDFGRFRFVDLGDLSGHPQSALFCPNDLLGPVDLFLVPHHGGVDAADPATFGAVAPRAAVMNNGLTKGGAPETFAALHNAMGKLDVWQLHRSANEGVANFADERIANPDESTSFWIKVSARDDGSFNVTNARTGAVQSYGPHP